MPDQWGKVTATARQLAWELVINMADLVVLRYLLPMVLGGTLTPHQKKGFFCYFFKKMAFFKDLKIALNFHLFSPIIFSSIGALDVQMSVCRSVGLSVCRSGCR